MPDQQFNLFALLVSVLGWSSHVCRSICDEFHFRSLSGMQFIKLILIKVRYDLVKNGLALKEVIEMWIKRRRRWLLTKNSLRKQSSSIKKGALSLWFPIYNLNFQYLQLHITKLASDDIFYSEINSFRWNLSKICLFGFYV